MYDRANRKPKADPRASAGPAARAPVQRAAAPTPYHSLPGSVGLTQPNRTGLPDGLKSSIEGLSGLSMDDVRVHRGSSRPATIQAHAYTQGSEIHLAPGQERHLAHEAWHVVQQKQGRVAPTMRLGDTAINDDAGLEGEADRMGDRALANPSPSGIGTGDASRALPASGGVVQGKLYMMDTPIGLTKSAVEARWLSKAGTSARRLAGSQVTFDEVMTQLETWAADDVTERRYYRKYETLFRAAVGAILERKKAERGPSAPVTNFDPVGDPFDLGRMLESQAVSKVKQSAELRRSASLSVEDTEGLRTAATRSFRHKDDTALRYRVETWGHKLEGGASDHTYLGLINKLKSPERTEQQIAGILADALIGGDYPEGARDVVRKFVAIVHSSELARAAINPTAMYAALRNFAAGRSKDPEGLFHYLQNTVLFVMAEDDNKGLGGSKMSQHHRGEVKFDRSNAVFSRIAVAEYDAMAKFGASLGHDVSTPEGFTAFVKKLTAFLEAARSKIFPEEHRSFKRLPSSSLAASSVPVRDPGTSSTPVHDPGPMLPGTPPLDILSDPGTSVIDLGEEEEEPPLSATPPLRRSSSSAKRSRSERDMEVPAKGQPVLKEARTPRGVRISDLRDAVEFEGHLFAPNVEGVRDLGECLWDTLRRLGVTDTKLGEAAVAAGVTVDAHVDVQKLAPLLDALRDRGVTIRVRLVTIDLALLLVTHAMTYGNAGPTAYVGLFTQGDEGHFVPGIPKRK